MLARVRGLAVHIQEDQGRFVGALRVEARQGASAVRRVHDSTCEQVARGLAVVAAIALGGSGSEDAANAVAGDELPERAAPASVHPTATRHAAEASAKPTQPPPTKPKRRQPWLGSSYTTPSAAPAPEGVVELGRVNNYTLTGGVELGLLPGVTLPRVGFSLQRADFLGTGTKNYLMGPILQMHGTILGPGTRRSNDGFEIHAFGWRVGVGVCSALAYDMTGFSALFCADFELGILKMKTSRGSDVVQKRDVGFGTASLSMDLKYHFGSLFHAGVRAGAAAYMGDLRAQRPDGSQLFDESVLGGHLTGSLGMHFW